MQIRKNTNSLIMKLCSIYVLFVIPLTAWLSEAYRILGVCPFNGSSHFVMFGRLMEELAARGHRVDVVGHYPLKKPLPNYNDIVNWAGTMPSLHNNMSYEFGTKMLQESLMVVTIATQLGGDFCDLMGLPEFRKLIENPPTDPPYDLVIVETFGATCYLALGQYLKVPVVGVVTSPMWPWANDMIANPDNPSYIPHVFSGLSGQMDFWQRIVNTVSLLRAKWQFSYYTAYQNEKMKEYLGPDAPSLKDAEQNMSLILVNSHHSLHGVRPFTTAVVEVGGLHIAENQITLPNEVQKWLDDSTNGFVFISFGSMLRIETFPKEMLAAIYSSLRKLAPIRVLIKVVKSNELPPDLPSNVLTLPWVPQLAVLQHKNIRAFVTHGGLMGTQEAIYHGVPMIGIPFFGDQTQNIELYVKKKIAVLLHHNQLTEKTLDAAFNAVLHDPSYMASARRLSVEFRDRPMTAVDTAIFWVEYVIRHGGVNIRSPALDLTWWQIALLDVYGALLLTAALAIYLLNVVIYKLIGVVLGSNVKSSLRSKKNE